MKIIVDLINKSLKVLENEKNIYVGNNNADVLEVYCYNGGYHLENEFVSITGLLSNGRKIGPFTTDSAYDEEYIDGKLHTLAKFTLTKQNGFTLSEGQLNITVWHNKTNDSGAIVSKQAIGNLLFNVVKTANVDDNIIITDASGDVINNFKLEIENIQSAVNSVNSSFVKFKQHTEESIMRLEDNKADLEVMWDAFDNYSEQIPYGDRKFAWLLNFTGDSLLIDMINELKSRDLFVDDKGKFWVEIGLENPTVIEDIRITKQKKANGYLTGYGINSIIRSGTTIRVFMKSVAKDSTMTINEFIDLHKQVAIKEEVPTKVSQLENDTEYISLEELNDAKDELRKYADDKVANLVNSAPSTLDTLGELAAALEDNKDVVEALDEAITKKADISYVDEKIANAGVPTDLLNRVETLETLSEEAVYMEDTEFDVEEETGGSGSGGTSGGTVDLDNYYNKNEIDVLIGNSRKAKFIGTFYLNADGNFYINEFGKTYPLKEQKFYLLQYYNDEWGVGGTTINYVIKDGNDYRFGLRTETVVSSYGGTPVVISIEYTYNENSYDAPYFSVNCSATNFIEAEDMDSIDVYELPFNYVEESWGV